MKNVLILLAALCASSATGDVREVVNAHVLPGYAAFADATVALENATAECNADAIRPAWNDTFDAWLGVSHLRFGPVEDEGRSVVIAFWPDARGATPKALAALIESEDPIIETRQGTARISVAARGLFALEYLLYDPQFSVRDAYSCALVRALVTDLAAIAEQVNEAWRNGYAMTLQTGGAEGNATYLSVREARQALFTALLTGLEFTADQRLGRPLGTFERPRPTRAETWRSGRSQRNVILSLTALSDLAQYLTDSDTPLTDAAFSRAIDLATTLNDPDFAGVETPSSRLKIEIVQQAVQGARDAAMAEIGPSLGVSAGFNSADGD